MITVTSGDQSDGITLTVADTDPVPQPDHLYGAPFIDDGRKHAVALPVIAHAAIHHIHIW